MKIQETNLVFLFSLALAQSLPTLKPGDCSQVECTTAPDGLNCTSAEVTNPVVLKKLGPLKDCCPAWDCEEADGSVSTYFGLSGGEEDEKDTKAAAGSKDGVTAASVNLEVSTSAEEADACGIVSCPMPFVKRGDCQVSDSADVAKFKGSGMFVDCCPLYNCTDSAGDTHTSFGVVGGTIPTAKSKIIAEKGSPSTEAKKCPAIICGEKPKDSNCVATKDTNSSLIQSLGSFRECCSLWKCSLKDGGHSVFFEMSGKTFWVTETSFFAPKHIITDNNIPSSSKSIVTTPAVATAANIPPTSTGLDSKSALVSSGDNSFAQSLQQHQQSGYSNSGSSQTTIVNGKATVIAASQKNGEKPVVTVTTNDANFGRGVDGAAQTNPENKNSAGLVQQPMQPMPNVNFQSMNMPQMNFPPMPQIPPINMQSMNMPQMQPMNGNMQQMGMSSPNMAPMGMQPMNINMPMMQLG